MALLLSAYVIVLYLLRGSAPFEASNTTLGETLLTYLFGGISSGIVLGALLPISATKPGAMLLGVLAMFPVYYGAALTSPQADPSGSRALVFAVILSTFTGSILGWKAHGYLSK